MAILMIMAVGIGVGFCGFPQKWGRYNHWVQLMSIMTLIFCMGVGLGSNESFITDLFSLGIKGVIFAIIPIICSIGVVYGMTQRWMKERQDD